MNDREVAYKTALLMYVNEPCRICGRVIRREDLHDSVFAGYSKDNKSRAAHKRCWDGFVEMVRDLGIDLEEAIKNKHQKVREKYGYEDNCR